MTGPSDGTPVDSLRLAAFEREIGRAHLAEVIDTFLNDADELVTRIGAAVQHGDAASGVRAARRLGSACAVLGIGPSASLCTEVDLALSARAAIDGRLDAQLAQLATSVAAVTAALRAARQTLAT
jgi:HPt (histidine-containing phosphotransfer) domain-containing protein